MTELLRDHDLRLFAAAIAASGLGSVLALAALQLADGLTGARRARSVAVAGLTLGTTAWLAVLACLAGYFPHLDAQIPLPAQLQSLAIAGAGGVTAVTIVSYGTRSRRNIALAGSAFAATVSCMLFAAMTGLAAPLPLGYDLGQVLVVMAAGSALSGVGLWQLRRPGISAPIAPPSVVLGPIAFPSGALRRFAALLLAALPVAASMVLVAIGSLVAILPFTDWEAARAASDGFAFRPLTVVSASEFVVTLVLGLAAAGVDRQAAGRVARDNERLRQLTESTFEALLIHRDGHVLDANTACCALFARPLHALIGANVATLLPAIPTPADDGPVPAIEAELHLDDGQPLPVELLARSIAYTGGIAQVTALRDIRERRIAEERIRYLAHYDILTGLPNRALFADIVTRQFAINRRDGGGAALFCMDLDRFKAVNDTLGHQAGDALLRAVAERLQKGMRSADTIARIGGDEFVLLQVGGTQPEAAAQHAERLIDAFAAPFDLAGQLVSVGLSIGIALFPQDGDTADTLVKHADIALYRAKTEGRGRAYFFKTGMDAELRARRAMEQDLAHAIATRAFELAYQPLFDSDGRTVVGFEALLRWPHPTSGMIPPIEFIPLAEETGLIVPLGTWALETACAAAAAWPVRRRVAVNVSPRQFSGGALPAIVARALERSGLPAGFLELEITESLLIQDTDQALLMLRALKAMGVRIALDDFGTGYSSLSYLRRFPFDKVKIDKSFVQALMQDAGARAIVGATLAMSHQLELEVTAEGVETADQLALLRAQSCDQIQGFLLGRPMSSAQVGPYLADRQRATHAGALVLHGADPMPALD